MRVEYRGLGGVESYTEVYIKYGSRGEVERSMGVVYTGMGGDRDIHQVWE